MTNVSLYRMILSGLIGIAIGVVFTAVVNLASPLDNLVRTIIVACLAALVSALSGYILGARQKQKTV